MAKKHQTLYRMIIIYLIMIGIQYATGFDKMFINAAKSIKGTWRPATIHGVNVETKLEIPLTIGEE